MDFFHLFPYLLPPFSFIHYPQRNKSAHLSDLIRSRSILIQPRCAAVNRNITRYNTAIFVSTSLGGKSEIKSFNKVDVPANFQTNS